MLDSRILNLLSAIIGFKHFVQGINLLKKDIGRTARLQIPMTDPSGNVPKTEKRKREGPDAILRKKTLSLGELDLDSSSEETIEEIITETKGTDEKKQRDMVDIDTKFPRWWEEDQHLATCLCDFCKAYYGRTAESVEAELLGSTSMSSAPIASDSIDGKHACPPSPTAA